MFSRFFFFFWWSLFSLVFFCLFVFERPVSPGVAQGGLRILIPTNTGSFTFQQNSPFLGAFGQGFPLPWSMSKFK